MQNVRSAENKNQCDKSRWQWPSGAVQSHPTTYDKSLPARRTEGLGLASKANPNESTFMTPNLLTMGREVRLPGELVFTSTNSYNCEEITSYGELVDDLRSRMQHAHEIAHKYMSIAAKRSKEL